MAKNDSKNGKSNKQIWIIVAVILFVIIGVAAAGGDKDGAKKIGEDASSSQTNDAKTEFTVGDVIAFDQKEVVVKSVDRNWNSGDSYIKPSDGKEYVHVTISITNKSSDKISYNVYDWSMEDSTGDIKSQTFVTGDDDNLSSGDLAAGGTKTGSIVFEVPKGDAGLKLHYEPSFWSSKELTIKL